MIGYLSNKGQVRVAWTLFFLFYFQFTGIAFNGILHLIKEDKKESSGYFTNKMVAEKEVGNYPPGVDSSNKELHDPLKVNQSIEKIVATQITNANIPATKDIGGPGQPEMSSFKSVGTNNMVNSFNGDFSYNIPLLDIGGYPVNLFYNAGISMEDEASWVGLGWNINPGTISRNMRGLPDDYDGSAADGDKITKKQNLREDLTVGANVGLNSEFAGFPVGFGADAGIFWNNRRGVGLEIGGNFSFQKSLGKTGNTEKTTKATGLVFNVGTTLNSQTGVNANLGFEVYKTETDNKTTQGLGASIDYNSRRGINDLKISCSISKEGTKGSEELGIKNIDPWGTNLSGNISFAKSTYTPTVRMPITRVSGYLQVKLGLDYAVFHPNAYIKGSMNTSYIAKDDIEQVKPAYGYMYYDRAEDRNALMDFNRLNDGTYSLKSPVISVPQYTPDIFTIQGEGTGGSFRGFRGNMGYVRDNYTKSKAGSFNLALDMGAAFIFHGGIDGIGGVYSTTEVGEWESDNALRQVVKFDNSKADYQGFYFKNPFEKTIIDENYYATAGGEKLVRPKLASLSSPFPMLTNAFETFDADKKYLNDISLSKENTRKNIRDKRTQIITSLTAMEASLVGLQKQIISYNENQFKADGCDNFTAIKRYNAGDETYPRKAHHLSEIDVLEADGKRYVYGIPAYNLVRKEVTFSIDANQGNLSTQLATYVSGQNTEENKKGKDHYFQSEKVNGFAHSFLLTAILSPDYSDLTGDGISDDDIGTAVKFNYTRVNKTPGANSWKPQVWRTPMGSNAAHYNAGLRTDNGDDKGLYTYGKKELWYTHSIESKNMIAIFILETRHDSHGIVTNELLPPTEDGAGSGEDGGADFSPGGQRKLARIELYTKAEFKKQFPKPVKTVHFEYDYSLCGSVPSNDWIGETVNGVNINLAAGKLTLKSVWFSYNGNVQAVKNKYRFQYPGVKIITINGVSTAVNCNPNYSTNDADRWSSYKEKTGNPSISTAPNYMDNIDYPYTLQRPGKEIAKTNAFASAWNLEKILLPSGSIITINYEADDYAYVQDKRAAQMTKVAGFAEDLADGPSNMLYKFDFFRVGEPGNMDFNYVFFDVDDPVVNTDPAYPDKTSAEIKLKYFGGIKQVLLRLWVKMPSDFNGSGFEPINVYGTVDGENYGVVQGNTKRIWIKLNRSGTGGSQAMETVMQFGKDNLPSKMYPGYDAGNETAVRQLVNAVYGLASGFFQAVQGFEYNLKSQNKCREVDLEKSFARLTNPFYSKKGGGHRVKSIVISDNWQRMVGNNADHAYSSTYGQEYDYTSREIINGVEKVISSGVATYEPGVGNEENPFKEILQYSEHQPLGPTNISNVEMPITEAFFPAPGVGYAKVTVKSIHNRSNKNLKSAMGTQVTEFYTAREFPVITDFTDFDGRSRKHHKPNPITKILFNYSRDLLTLTQGFRIVLNDMNGKMKAQYSYAEDKPDEPVNSTVYYYKTTKVTDQTYRPENNVPVINGSEGIVTNKLIGKDVEIMNDFREHAASTTSVQIPLNINSFTAGPIPIVILNILHMASYETSVYRSATTLKIINEYGILDSIVNIDKGSQVSTKNLVYDAETGEVLESRTNNSFNKPIYNLSYPAHWVNSGMDLAYKNIDLTYEKVTFKNGRIILDPNGTQVDMTKFESGDELFVLSENNAVPEGGIVNDCTSAGFPEPPTSFNWENRIWAIDVAKDDDNVDHSFIFLDRFGNPYTGIDVYLRVIRSGKRNFVSTSVGSISSLSDPIVDVSGVKKIRVDNASNVLNASAGEFKEKWRVQNSFYSKIVTQVYDHFVVLKNLPFTPTSVHTTSMSNWGCGWPNPCNDHFFHTSTAAELLLRKTKTKVNRLEPIIVLGAVVGFHNVEYDQPKENQFFLYFDINTTNFPSNYNLYSAKLNLMAHQLGAGQTHNFKYFNPNASGNFFNNGSHISADPHYSLQNLNSFWISKMQMPWPSSDIGFETPFNQSPFGTTSVLAHGPTSPAMNYIGPNAIDISSVVQSMLQDRTNLGYLPGIKLNLSIAGNATHNVETRVCFDGDGSIDNFNTSLSNLNGSKSIIKSEGPTLDVQYYDCADALPAGEPPPTVPYANCPYVESLPQCFSVFDKNQMNPYVQGVLGNWRPWHNYVYYGERKEIDPTAATDLVKNGVIDNFESFWLPSSNFMQKSNSIKWVWNTETTQSNRKGIEIENKDPLNRYNSGVYGYQETLPIAVANNARVREIAFEGFEDYDYNDQQCGLFCSPYTRHFDPGNVSDKLSDVVHHTGKKSLKIGSQSNLILESAVKPDDNVTSPDLNIQLLNNNFSFASATLSGTGLTPRYYNNTTFTPPYTTGSPRLPSVSFSQQYISNFPDPICSVGSPQNGCSNLSIEWNGSIVTAHTGDYNFKLAGATGFADDEADVFIGGLLVAHSEISTSTNTSTIFHMVAGQAYPITVKFKQTYGYGQMQLLWKKNYSSALTPVPLANLYPVGATIPAAVAGLGNCAVPGNIELLNHKFIDVFSLRKGQHYVFSAWVRQGETDCSCTTYAQNAVEILANDVTITGERRTSGSIIEGWQRYEFDFTVPLTTNNIKILLKNQSTSDIYFDDLRINPFNSSMKSFVYSPENLRLSAELDENNYATFYEYDDEGTLVRLKKETKDGIKTIKETRSAIQKNILDF